MKNILIPTDFSIRSLKLVSAAAGRFQDEQLNIILVHALEPDNSISGLLMLNKRLKAHQLYSEEFTEACEVLRNKYASVIHKMKVEFYYGETRFYRKGFLEAREIDAIFFSSEYTLGLPSKSSMDMQKIFGNSGYPVFLESGNTITNNAFAEADSLSELLQA